MQQPLSSFNVRLETPLALPVFVCLATCAPIFFFFKDSRFSAKIVLFGELISAKALLLLNLTQHYNKHG